VVSRSKENQPFRQRAKCFLGGIKEMIKYSCKKSRWIFILLVLAQFFNNDFPLVGEKYELEIKPSWGTKMRKAVVKVGLCCFFFFLFLPL